MQKDMEGLVKASYKAYDLDVNCAERERPVTDFAIPLVCMYSVLAMGPLYWMIILRWVYKKQKKLEASEEALEASEEALQSPPEATPASPSDPAGPGTASAADGGTAIARCCCGCYWGDRGPEESRR